ANTAPDSVSSLDAVSLLVHERKHFDGGRGHVKCEPNDDSKNCEAKFHMLSARDENFEEQINDLDVGAYSMDITYLADFYHYGQGHDLARSTAQILTRHIMTNRFKGRSDQHPEGLTNEQLVRALNRVDAQ
ncbi:MAG: hypothetical protein MJK18_07265, partial [Bdellovibrionales bacterium]|nr:hypothetical protein [Bdellovibrionales bacterium]